MYLIRSNEIDEESGTTNVVIDNYPMTTQAMIQQQQLDTRLPARKRRNK